MIGRMADRPNGTTRCYNAKICGLKYKYPHFTPRGSGPRALLGMSATVLRLRGRRRPLDRLFAAMFLFMVVGRRPRSCVSVVCLFHFGFPVYVSFVFSFLFLLLVASRLILIGVDKPIRVKDGRIRRRIKHSGNQCGAKSVWVEGRGNGTERGASGGT